MSAFQLSVQSLFTLFFEGDDNGFESSTNDQSTLSLTDDKQPATLANGAVAGKINKGFRKKYTITAGSSVTIDLQALPAPDGSGNQTLTRVVLLAVKIPTNSGAIAEVGGAASDAFEGWQGPAAPAGGTYTVAKFDIKYRSDATGFVVDATHRNIKIKNNGATGDVQILIAGS